VSKKEKKDRLTGFTPEITSLWGHHTRSATLRVFVMRDCANSRDACSSGGSAPLQKAERKAVKRGREDNRAGISCVLCRRGDESASSSQEYKPAEKEMYKDLKSNQNLRERIVFGGKWRTLRLTRYGHHAGESRRKGDDKMA